MLAVVKFFVMEANTMSNTSSHVPDAQQVKSFLLGLQQNICQRLELLDGKATSFFYGTGEFFLELIKGLVRRDVDAVEACVSLGQIVCRSVDQVDREQARTVGSRRSLQSFEPLLKKGILCT